MGKLGLESGGVLYASTRSSFTIADPFAVWAAAEMGADIDCVALGTRLARRDGKIEWRDRIACHPPRAPADGTCGYWRPSAALSDRITASAYSLVRDLLERRHLDNHEGHV